jgi:hypothetical protein
MKCPQCQQKVSWIRHWPKGPRQCPKCSVWLQVTNHDRWALLLSVMLVISVAGNLYRQWMRHWDQNMTDVVLLVVTVLVFLPIFAYLAKLEVTKPPLAKTPEMRKWERIMGIIGVFGMAFVVGDWASRLWMLRQMDVAIRNPSHEAFDRVLRTFLGVSALLMVLAMVLFAIFSVTLVMYSRAKRKRDREAQRISEE